MPVIETTNGKVRGTENGGVRVFRGIRYGANTGGANRFRPPQPPKRWQGIRDAMAPGASAPQLARPENTDPFFSWYSVIEPPSEDCLFLNVFTPGTDEARRPILFWIHGGGWREYSGTAPGFDGTALARAEDVVVVTINHRLGVFGHLKLESGDPDFADSGNAGSLDVLAALEWVRDNADVIGGDPDNITLFGESGGASKIAAILSMPRAKGLFHKAVLQSSAGGMRLAEPDEAARNAESLSKTLGLTCAGPQALKDVPMQAMLEAAAKAPMPFRGAIDGRTYVEHPYSGKASAAAVGVPLLVGTTLTEATYYMRDDPENFALDFIRATRRLRNFFEVDDKIAAGIVATYRDEYPVASASEILFLASSDYIFKCNSYRMGTFHSAAGAPVYAYHFEWRSPVENGRMGSPHTCEVPFVFGTTNAARACVGDGTELKQMTRLMMRSWASFARNGDPNNELVPYWDRYDDSQRAMMCLDTEPRSERDPGGHARNALSVLPEFGYGHVIPRITAD